MAMEVRLLSPCTPHLESWPPSVPESGSPQPPRTPAPEDRRSMHVCCCSVYITGKRTILRSVMWHEDICGITTRIRDLFLKFGNNS